MFLKEKVIFSRGYRINVRLSTENIMEILSVDKWNFFVWSDTEYTLKWMLLFNKSLCLKIG